MHAPLPGSAETEPLLRHQYEDSESSESSESFSSSASDDSSQFEARKPRVSSRVPSQGMSTTRIVAAIGFTWLGSFLAALDTTITSTLSATIASEFGTLSIISWLGSAYLIAMTVVQPLSGKLTDIFGRRAGLLLCCALFAAGNTICGLAQRQSTLIIGRAAAGLGGGGLNSICTFVGTDLIPLRKRGVIQGIGMITFSSGIALGGVVGGIVNEAVGWRWAFLILFPLAIVTAIGVYFSVPGPPSCKGQSTWSRVRRIDFSGSILLTVALVLLLWSLNSEGDQGLFLQHQFLITLPIVVFFLALFVFNEVRHAIEPIIPMSMLRNGTVTAACLVSWFESMSLYTLLFHVPLYFRLRGLDTQEVGIRLLPESIGTALGSLGSGIIMRSTGEYGTLKLFVLATFVVGPGGFALSGLSTSAVLPEVFLLFHGLGFGGMLTTMTLCLLSAIDHEMQAVATAVMYAFRSVGGSIAVAISGLLFRKTLAMHLARLDHLYETPVLLQNCHIAGGKDQNCPAEVLEAYMLSLRAVFLLAVGFAVAGMISGLFTRNNTLRTTFTNTNDS